VLELARGRFALLSTAAGQVIVKTPRGATLAGCRDLTQLPAGTRLRVRYAREVNGVKLADFVEAEPELHAEADLLVRVPEAARLLAAPHGAERWAVAVDARGPARFAAGHLPGALHTAGEEVEPLSAALPADTSTPIIVYGDDARCPLAHRALRWALSRGYTHTRLLRAGLAGWWEAGYHTEVEADHLVDRLAPGSHTKHRDFLVVDVRSFHEGAAQSIPNALTIPVEAMQWQQFVGEAWMPPFVFVGADDKDQRPAAAARRTLGWRYRSAMRARVPVHVLRGGLQAWRTAGGATVERARGPKPIAYEPHTTAGEIAPQRFAALWAARHEAAVTLLDGAYGLRSRIAHQILSRNGYRSSYLPMRPPMRPQAVR
jgi:rhodanese-related sulfurtransferase